MQFKNSHVQPRKTQRGLGLVELMVGITVGLIVTAGAAMVATRQINEHRRLMLEVQMQQDLRIAADLIQQDLKRAGYRGLASKGVWEPERDGGATPAKNAVPSPYFAASSNQTGDEFYYQYWKDSATNAVSNSEKFGSRGDQGEQKLYIQLGMMANGTDPNWQPITDPDVVKIENFVANVVTQQISLADLCDPTIACSAGSCPTQTVRRVVFTIKAVAKADRNVQRTLTVGEKLRADEISGVCPT